MTEYPHLPTFGPYPIVCVVRRALSLPLTANQEGLQILHYRDGQKYEAHFDYFHDAVNAAPAMGGQRLMTMLMYL